MVSNTFICLLFILFSVQHKAVVTDTTALLRFKSAIVDPSNSLSSWHPSTSPCSSQWVGVTCVPSTHLVSKLVLESLNLSGPIDSLMTHNLSHLRVLSLKSNMLYSSAWNISFASWPNLKHLYLAHNAFSGSFPSGFSPRIRRLDLSFNSFSGHIPLSQLSHATGLLTLGLESNSFTGRINSPIPTSSFMSLLEFNVSGNDLTGEIPAWLSRFPATSFSGNKNLCGPPLLLRCSVPAEGVPRGQSTMTASHDDGEKSNPVSNWIVIFIVVIDVVALLAALVTITCCCCYYNTHNIKSSSRRHLTRKSSSTHTTTTSMVSEGGEVMVLFQGCKGFADVDDLLKSSAEFLGQGSVGTTYRVELEGGDVAVVKRVREQRRRRRTDVDAWLMLIGGLRHVNVGSLRAYYNSRDELLLVYDFLPCGSLHSLLHGNRGPGRTALEWTTRLRLASEAAKGLAFLHNYHKAKLYHGNLKSSNIIIDRTGNACITDISLHQLLHSPPISPNNSYKAPELTTLAPNNSSQRKYSQKCDVYSFGVVLLEILTGKVPSGEEETSLVKWVQRVCNNNTNNGCNDLWEVFDFELLRYKEMEHEMVALLHVGLLCVATSPRDRPKMNMVYSLIEDIRTSNGVKLSDGCTTTSSIMSNLSSDSSPSQSDMNIVNFNFRS